MNSLACLLDSEIEPSWLCFFILIYPVYQQFFFGIEVLARPESPSSVSRENNCMKKEINRGK